MCVGCGIKLMPAKHFGITQSSVGVKKALFKIESLLLSTQLINWYSCYIYGLLSLLRQWEC